MTGAHAWRPGGRAVCARAAPSFGVDTVVSFKTGRDRVDIRGAGLTFATLALEAVDADGDGTVDDTRLVIATVGVRGTFLFLDTAPAAVTATDFFF